MRLALLILSLAALSGCCYQSRYYAGPAQSMVQHQTTVFSAPQQPDTAPRVHVTRRYMGARPAWYEVGYYLPEPTIVRDCNGNMWVEEYVWGYPPPNVATPVTAR